MASHEVRVVLLQVDSEADSELGGVVEIDDVGRVDLALVVGVGQECAAMSVLLLVEVGRSTDGSEAVVEVLAVVMVEALGLALVGRVAVLVVGRPDLDSALDALVHGVANRGDSRLGSSGASQSSSDDSIGAENLRDSQQVHKRGVSMDGR